MQRSLAVAKPKRFWQRFKEIEPKWCKWTFAKYFKATGASRNRNLLPYQVHSPCPK